MALEALAKFAAMTMAPSGNSNLAISIQADQQLKYQFANVTKENALILQSFQVPGRFDAACASHAVIVPISFSL